MSPLSPLHQLFADFWQTWLRLDPLLATQCGSRAYNDRLPQVGEAAVEAQRQALRAALARLGQLPAAGRTPSDQTNAAVFEAMLRAELSLREIPLYRMSLSRAGGFHTYFLDIILLTPFESRADYEAYLQRLRGFREYTRQNLELLRAGLHSGYVASKAALNGVLESVTSQIVADPRDSLLFAPLRRFPVGISAADQERLRTSALEAVRGSVLPAFEDFRDFLVTEYLPAGMNFIAASRLPGGLPLYETMLRYHTTTRLTPRQIHQTGLEEVARIRAEMEALKARVGFSGSLAAFIQALRSDPRFYVDTPAQLLKEVALILKRMDGELPGLFGSLPRLPYGIRETPAYLAPTSTSAYYFPSPGDGNKAGFYYVNTYDLKSRPLYEYEALSFHEAVPGHHLQIALQQELEGLPEFRRYYSFTAYVEGWALYAERLGLEVGFYTDPYSDFGRLTYEMWRACRLVVDTGMHAFDWTRQQAIDFMAENSALSLLNIANEVDRYIAWPGQALAYKIGELKIRELRARAEHRLGAAFDRRAFHDCLLASGPLPLDLLEQQVLDWIERLSQKPSLPPPAL